MRSNYSNYDDINNHTGMSYRKNESDPRMDRPKCITIGDDMSYNHRHNQYTDDRKIRTDNNFNDIQSAMPWHLSNSSNLSPSNEQYYSHKSDNVNNQTRYYNPYEYGSRQNELGSLYKPTYIGPYSIDAAIERPTLDCMGVSEVSYNELFPGAIRNVNVESSLLQREMTHVPGQRELTEVEINRFELLPFDPQDTRHIVWRDNMPRGGYPSRSDRLEII